MNDVAICFGNESNKQQDQKKGKKKFKRRVMEFLLDYH
jgi:hypothetical protein